MNRQQRALIRQTITRIRPRLEDDIIQRLLFYGLRDDGTRIPVASLQHLNKTELGTRERLEKAIEKQKAGRLADADATARYVRHVAFTWLNRLAALRAMEVRGFLGKETVLRRPEFGGRSLRERDIAENQPHRSPDDVLMASLREACGEAGAQIGMVFDVEDEYSLVMPSPRVLRETMDALAEIPKDLWQADEVLGWIYQYFNSEAREEIRPRLRRNPSPDDIPPVNQFYTVDWIVKALAQNTLGRLWLEAHPASSLRTHLGYFVPLQNGLQIQNPQSAIRNFRVLDPACGSGHFLLGAFDLLLEMWREEQPNLPPWRIPALILEHNLFGVDIDLRATQIAAIALYLKARTAFERLKGDDPSARFELRRLNIVCADVRFVDGKRGHDFMQQFAADTVLQRIVKQTLEACENAFDIGSLLQIRQPFEKLFSQRTAKVEELRQKQRQLSLFPLQEEQLSLGDVSVPVPKPLTVEEIVAHVRDFVRQASQAQDMGSLLFGLDAERAIHLVDVLTDRYDVVLMNPPYGAMPPICKQYARQHYPRTHSDYYAAFIEQAVDLCKEGGYVGALTGRTFLFLKSFQRLREEILRAEALPEIVWDLGFNVLDEATARYAAFTLRKRHSHDGINWSEHPVTFFRLTDWDWDEKRVRFEETLKGLAAQ